MKKTEIRIGKNAWEIRNKERRRTCKSVMRSSSSCGNGNIYVNCFRY